MDSPYSFTVTDSSIAVVEKATGRTHTVAVGTPNYAPLKAAIQAQDWASVPQHLEVRKSIEAWSKGNFKFDGGKILYKGEEIPGVLGKRVREMATRGESVDYLLKFWERLKKNPSWRSVEQLFGFLEHTGIPIGPNGFFRAYKGVKENMTDAHTGKVDNKPGAVNEMDRNKVSDDPKEACHYGYHVGDLSYAASFAAVTVICEVDPADVVCIPYDQSKRKMRVCKYKVIGLSNGDLMESTAYELEPELGTESEVLQVGDEEDLEPEEEAPAEPKGTPATTVEGTETQVPKPPRERKMRKPRENDTRVPLKVAKKWRDHCDMNMGQLMALTREELNQFATRALSIINAPKLKSKSELVKQIMKVRKSYRFI